LKNELLDEKYLPFQISANCPVLIFMPLLISAIGISNIELATSSVIKRAKKYLGAKQKNKV
jgi:hypothetical protein